MRPNRTARPIPSSPAMALSLSLMALVALVLAIAAVAPAAAQAAESTQTMWRLYNPYSGEHLYTASTTERDSLAKAGWRKEGVGWIAPKSSKTPVFRLYNKYNGEHHYTLDKRERDALVKIGWTSEGVGWYSDDAKRVPVYRQFNPYVKANSHNYTRDKGENDQLVKLGWRAEGIGWYGVAGDVQPVSPSKPSSGGGSSKPSTTQPASKPSTPSKPATSQPATSKPATSKPATTKPATTKPATTQPATTKPATTQPATKPATPQTVRYTVRHWQQKVDGGSAHGSANYDLVSTQTSSAKVGSTVTPARNSYRGFDAPAGQTVRVSSGGTTVDYYYTRKSYKLTVSGGEGIASTSGSGTYRYGRRVTVGAKAASGYEFSGWSTNGPTLSNGDSFSFVMPDYDVWVAASAKKKGVTLQEASIPDGYYTMRSLVGQNCYLDISGQSVENGGAAQIWGNTGAAAQYFRFVDMGGGWYRITNGYSNLSLSPDRNGATDGTKIHQWAYNFEDTQLWKPYKASDGSYVFVAKATGKALDVAGGYDTPGTRVQLWDQNNTEAQRWVLSKVSYSQPAVTDIAEGCYRLRSRVDTVNAAYLEVGGMSIYDGGNVSIWGDTGAACQAWRITPNGNGTYRIINANSLFALEVGGGATNESANVQQWTYLGAKNQQWRAYRSIYGGLVFVDSNSGRALDVSGGNPKPGTNVDIWSRNDATAQSWSLEGAPQFAMSYEREVFKAYNNFRAREGIGAMNWSDEYARRAYDDARYSASRNALEHSYLRNRYPINSSSPTSSVLAYSWGYKEEPSELVNRWANSSGHKAQMRCSTGWDAGVGAVYQGGKWWYSIAYAYRGTSVG